MQNYTKSLMQRAWRRIETARERTPGIEEEEVVRDGKTPQFSHQHGRAFIGPV
jgi:hypothetical protein